MRSREGCFELSNQLVNLGFITVKVFLHLRDLMMFFVCLIMEMFLYFFVLFDL